MKKKETSIKHESFKFLRAPNNTPAVLAQIDFKWQFSTARSSTIFGCPFEYWKGLFDINILETAICLRILLLRCHREFQLKLDSKQQLEKLLMTILFTLRLSAGNLKRESCRKKYFFILFFFKDDWPEFQIGPCVL